MLWFKPVAVCQICNVYAEQYIFIAATSCVAAIWRPLFFSCVLSSMSKFSFCAGSVILENAQLQ